ncbi:putative Dol-P-Glc:Glc(2)Man(9)GlcNAc(2)-PP-Dol alpha-1,2-glucosyltransferase [Maniola jurtina]|uniref:putative Dol-P-Glc:Glc(2)Man(9)GlcNAc(2)-PP-Dol alpha-1,2-glucosyltransferase n=1 Tax=Maniola jurtina TaxID=191418 RepID=UPI001E685F67|nr:putative Dol-P-Glc:Glc(2)Man(9)GlcNAc(2)-PP-Dol alpha-1,2-glucosyltransferase [Maniola jurtina]XP_045782129.1 putative Dol-P-Glc:Glc(2)Man(9)GlcNAc(2)-PP-Dol alpha-1,2-glucosyltransferase [Maniola jurtina]
MKSSTRYYILLITAVTLYFAVSKVIFDRVNETSQIIVDELFHIPQGISFCEGNFSYWDPKITTLPGLHLTSAIVGYYFPCNTYNLRFVNLVASCFNLMLFVSILTFIYGSYNERQIKIVLQALSLTILPPLYFFSHVYYTDTLSLLFLLAFSRLCFGHKGKWLILLIGNLSVLMRQTNIVWIAMVLGHKLLDILIRSSRVYGNRYLSKTVMSQRSIIANDVDSSKLKRYYTISDVIVALKFHLSTCFKVPFKFISLSDLYVIIQQLSVLVSFSIFLYVNGSIVIGDKKAHEATIHIPQLLYFLLFYGVFGLPYVLAKFISTTKLIFKNKFNVLLLSIIIGIVVHYNTIVHPYLLADNRHYTFYIWNRWFGKYDYAIYATIPVYVFLLFSLYDNLKDQNCISFLLPYCICLFFALALQKLVEIRYFLVPYIILRLRFVRPSFKVVWFELLWYIAINLVTFYIFFTKEIRWDDFEEVQRIIW